jgi:hypothetical protein
MSFTKSIVLPYRTTLHVWESRSGVAPQAMQDIVQTRSGIAGIGMRIVTVRLQRMNQDHLIAPLLSPIGVKHLVIRPYHSFNQSSSQFQFG